MEKHNLIYTLIVASVITIICGYGWLLADTSFLKWLAVLVWGILIVVIAGATVCYIEGSKEMQHRREIKQRIAA